MRQPSVIKWSSSFLQEDLCLALLQHFFTILKATHNTSASHAHQVHTARLIRARSCSRQSGSGASPPPLPQAAPPCTAVAGMRGMPAGTSSRNRRSGGTRRRPIRKERRLHKVSTSAAFSLQKPGTGEASCDLC